MNSQSFEDFIRQQKRIAEDAQFDKEKEIAEWRKQVAVFYEKVSSFLDRYTKDGTVKLDSRRFPMHEEGLGAYELDALTILLGQNRIALTPVGTMLIGAKGRIDMKGPRGTVSFVLVDKDSSAPKITARVQIGSQTPPSADGTSAAREWVWKISTPPPKVKYTELEEETFQTALMEVVNA